MCSRARCFRSSCAHVLAEFSKKALSEDMPVFQSLLSKAVIGNFVYVCRQLYNTCEGLVVLYPYDVHTFIATAWKVVSIDNLACYKCCDNMSVAYFLVYLLVSITFTVIK